ncbi:MAG: hypothetical protein IKN82_03295 [Treponema sp.]|nr:hypothetical protein [Treponema sp.]
MVKFFKLCAIAIILSVAVSCGNNAGSYNAGIYNAGSPATQEVSGLRSITISYIKNGPGENHGTVTASKTEGIAPGEKIYLTITPENGYQLDKLYARYYDGGAEKNIDVTDNSFVMPNKDVYIGVSFKETITLYNVSASETQNGKIQFSANGSDPQDTCQAAKGTTVTIFVLPNEGYEIDTLAASAGGNELAINGSAFAMPEGDVTVSATFKPVIKTYTVAIGTMTGGSVTVSPGTSVAAGTTVTLNPTPDNGYVLDSLTVKDASGNEILVTRNAFEMPQSDVTVSAVFKKIYTITINKPTNGNIGVETPRGRWTTKDAGQTIEAFAGETIVYDAILESGSIYKLKSFAINGVEGIDASKQKNSFVMPQSDVTISATFEEKSNYFISAECNTGGTVTPNEQYAREGEEVTVTVTPATGEKDYVVEKLCLSYDYFDGEGHFSRATIGLAFEKAGGQVKFTVPVARSSITVKATFAEKTYSIKLADNITGGSITGFNSSGNHLGQKIRLFVTPDDGYKLTGISIEGASVALDDCYCFEMPKADITIKPTFASNATGRNITINPSEHGSVSCAKTEGVMPGSTVVLMATPASGYKLNSFTVTKNGSGEVTVSDNTFIMPDSDVSVSAEFLNGEERDVYVWITLGGTSTTIEERWRRNIAPGTVVTSDSLPAGYVISSVYVTEYVTEHPELWNEGADIQLTSRTDTDYSFVMPDCNAHVHIYLKAPVKAKPDTVGDIVLKDGTAVARENRGYLSETQKNDAIAVIFYDGKSEFEWWSSKFLGRCVLGVGLAEGYGPWCGNYLGSDNGGYIEFNSTAAHPIYIGEGKIYGGHYYYANGEEIHHVQYYGAYNTCVYGATSPQVRFGGLLRGTNTFETVMNSVEKKEQMYAFNFCHGYKDQPGSRVKGTDYENGWYLPTLPELAELLRSVSYLEDVGTTYLDVAGVIRGLRAVNGTKITNSGDDYYWTSSQAREITQAWLAAGGNAKLLDYSKDASFAVRAIREF